MTENEEKNQDQEQPETVSSEKKPAAAKKKSAAKKEAPATAGKKQQQNDKALGVIGHIFMMCARPEGASSEEIINHLEKTFKDRERDAMDTTVRIQAGTRLQQQYNFEMQKKHDEKRGLVYRAPKGAFNEYLKSKGIVLTDKEKNLLEKKAA